MCLQESGSSVLYRMCRMLLDGSWQWPRVWKRTRQVFKKFVLDSAPSSPALLTEISHLSHLKPPSYPGDLPDSTGTDLSRRDSRLFDRSIVPILPPTAPHRGTPAFSAQQRPLPPRIAGLRSVAASATLHQRRRQFNAFLVRPSTPGGCWSLREARFDVPVSRKRQGGVLGSWRCGPRFAHAGRVTRSFGGAGVPRAVWPRRGEPGGPGGRRRIRRSPRSA